MNTSTTCWNELWVTFHVSLMRGGNRTLTVRMNICV